MPTLPNQKPEYVFCDSSKLTILSFKQVLLPTTNRVFHKLDEINIGIRGFTTLKKTSDKMLPQWE